jgi:hypothetical protein
LQEGFCGLVGDHTAQGYAHSVAGEDRNYAIGFPGYFRQGRLAEAHDACPPPLHGYLPPGNDDIP